MPSSFVLTDGTKSIPLESLPPEAWTTLGGESEPTDVQKYWRSVAWLRRAVEVRAHALSGVPWAVMEGETERWTWLEPEAPDDLAWLSDLIELLYLTEAALTLGGRAYWMIERNALKITGLRWLAPHSIKEKWDSRKGLIGYERDLGNGATPIKLEINEVVRFALPNPNHESNPAPAPAVAALAAAGVLHSVDVFARSYFERGAIKATLLTVEGNPPDTEIKKMESWWRRYFRGNSKAWESAVVRAGVTPQVVGEGLESLTNSELTNERRQDISTALGIPHSLLFSDAANYATAQQDELNLLRYTIIPDARLIERPINRTLLGPLGLRLQFRPDEMDVMQEDESQRATSLGQLVTAGVPLLTAMDILGYDLDDDEIAAIEQDIADKQAVEAQMRQAALARPQNDPTPTDRRANDVAKWQRKALNALRAGKSAAVSFESEHIEDDDADYIAHALEHATTAEEVKAAFELLPFLWEGYP